MTNEERAATVKRISDTVETMRGLLGLAFADHVSVSIIVHDKNDGSIIMANTDSEESAKQLAKSLGDYFKS